MRNFHSIRGGRALILSDNKRQSRLDSSTVVQYTHAADVAGCGLAYQLLGISLEDTLRTAAIPNVNALMAKNASIVPRHSADNERLHEDAPT